MTPSASSAADGSDRAAASGSAAVEKTGYLNEVGAPLRLCRSWRRFFT